MRLRVERLIRYGAKINFLETKMRIQFVEPECKFAITELLLKSLHEGYFGSDTNYFFLAF